MARVIDVTKPLSAADWAYAQDRPWIAEDARLAGIELERADDADLEGTPEELEQSDYQTWNVRDLKNEVTQRNLEREEDDLVHVEAPGNKNELIAALVADDKANAEEEDEEGDE